MPAGGGRRSLESGFSEPYRNAKFFFAVAKESHSPVTLEEYHVDGAIGLGGVVSINSANSRRFAISAGYSALAIGLPYGAVTYASPDTSGWTLIALCVCGLGFAGYRRSRSHRIFSD
jgi:hypothetical protein